VDYLKNNPSYHMAYLLDVEARQKSKNAFLVTLTKYKIISSGDYQYCQVSVTSPFIKGAERLFGRKKQGKSMYIDVSTTSGIKRVHNIHLSWPVGPETRVKQFSDFLATAKPNESHLVLGDLNTFGRFRNNVFAYALFGYSLKELFVNEKNIFQNFFEEYGWQNPFEGTTSPTWPWNLSGAQLDYILVSKNALIKYKGLLKDTSGSDHRPQILEIT
jgi:hypothetical protein